MRRFIEVIEKESDIDIIYIKLVYEGNYKVRVEI